ncbi:GNAT family N-acetyltransferase [Pseudanabaena biceps]|nr:GNAT family N-acetyltransferase [Pseudanabaena biceps]
MHHRYIRFSDRHEEVDLEQLQELLKVSAFWAKERTLKGLAIATSNSNPVITVWDSDRLIGHARATSDGIYRATIWDVVIALDYRGLGLGRKLVNTVLQHPLMCNVERVYLMTTHQQKFYEQIGFKQNSSSTLVLSNPSEEADIELLITASHEGAKS